jgi:hypothetical protein
MPRTFAVLACALALTACATKGGPVAGIPPVADPCPAEGLAAVRPEPIHPIVDPVELGTVFGAIAGVIGPERGQALVRFWETERPTWGRQATERLTRVKTWCDARQK